MHEKVVSVYEQDETAKNLNLGSVKHEYRTSDNEGCIGEKEFCENAFSSRPVPPLPFLNGVLLKESERYRIQNVWESSRALKRGRYQEDEEKEDIICAYCDEALRANVTVCVECGVKIHNQCINVYNTEWEINGNGNAIVQIEWVILTNLL